MSTVLKAIASAPLIHIALCYWFLFCFYSGFGGGTLALLGVEDIFSVSLSDLVVSYAIVIFGFVLGYWFLFENPTEVKGRQEFKLHPTLRTKPMEILQKIVPWLALTGLILNWVLLDRFISIIAVLLFAMVVGRVSGKFAVTNGFTERAMLIGAFALLSFANLTASAYRQGFALRHHPVSQLPEDVIRCQELLLHRSIGDYFVAIDQQGIRSIVDKSCAKAFDLPSRKVTLDIV